MKVQRARVVERNLRFKKAARTSRNTIRQKKSHFIVLEDTNGITGIGEASPIYGLSIEREVDFHHKLYDVVEQLNRGLPIRDLNLTGFPSIVFAIDTASRDILNGGLRKPFPGAFPEGKSELRINGLIWMDSIANMKFQVSEKIKSGFHCIKIKIGYDNFQSEKNMISEIRTEYGNSIELRLDANGAFPPDEAIELLDILAEFEIHSIEQPIQRGQTEKLREICMHSPIPIALDEELIGINPDEAHDLLDKINPKYIIIKPTLIGSFENCEHWVRTAGDLNIGWWATSALESNVGLNAISQWVSTYNPDIYQGLGTGLLYVNNIPSPLRIHGEKLKYNPSSTWDLNSIL